MNARSSLAEMMCVASSSLADDSSTVFEIDGRMVGASVTTAVSKIRGIEMRSRPSIPVSHLQKLVRRLLRINRPETDIPVMISTMDGDYYSSVGRLLQRGGARVLALVDIALERERAVTVFLPENAYLAEVTNCVAQGDHFTVELVLIQYQTD